MAFEGIKVSPHVLRDTAKKIEDINISLDEKLKEISKCLDQTDGSYISKDGRVIRDAMKSMNPRFEEYKAVVASYANFLKDTAESYASLERTLETNANQFKQP